MCTDVTPVFRPLHHIKDALPRLFADCRPGIVSGGVWQWIAVLCLLCATAHSSPGEGPDAVRELRTAKEVRALTTEEAGEALPVSLEGIYMGEADPEGIAFVVQDATEGVYVQAPPELVRGLRRGDLLKIQGVTNPGGYAPYVVADHLQIVGVSSIPEPIHATLNDLFAGQMDAQWIEIEGIVRSVEPEEQSDAAPPPPGTRYWIHNSDNTGGKKPVFKVKLASGNAQVMVQIKSPIDPRNYVDAKVRLRALCFNLHNRNRQFVKPFVQVPEGVSPEILVPPPENPFDEPPIPIASLFQFSVDSGNRGHRVHLRGVVVHHRAGSSLWLRDGEHCLRVETRQGEDLRPGDLVDVLGYPRPEEYSPILEDAEFRKYASGEPPPPVVLKDMPGALGNDANLVRLDTKLIAVRQFPESVELTLDWLGETILATLQTDEGARPPGSWEPYSLVRVQGICMVETDEPGPLGGLWIPRRFRLLLRSAGDVTILQPPPWWNAEHIIWLLSTFLLVTIGTIASVMWLSQQRLHKQMQRRAMAEAEFTAMLSERNRLAREIHDTLSQSLSAISLQLELARTHAKDLSEEIRNNLGTAHKLARAALAEARDSIWNMRSQVLESSDLCDALSRILEHIMDNANVKTSVNVEGTRRRLSPMVENNLLRIGQEAINNANKHASASEITVTLKFEKRQVLLSIEDNGIGFVEKAPTAGKRKSFGLLGIRERVDLLGGTVEIKSAPGQGIKVKVAIPA